MDIQQQVKEIKQSFRQLMDGAVSQSMRQKGVDYHLNWGVTLPRLRQMADEIKAALLPLPKGEREEDSSENNMSKAYYLAIALWKEDVRECKILATMLMPPEEMPSEVADIWMEQTVTVEIAEQAAFNLYQHLPYAADKAFGWLSSADDMPQLCGYHVLSRLFARRQELNARAINEFLDQALAALQSTNISLRKAAMQAVVHFAEMGIVYDRMAHAALRSIGMDFL